jgi:hypothetical protein
MVLRDIIGINCADMALFALIASSASYSGRWASLSPGVVIFIKCVYL